jgi:hypothetical protein
MQVLLEVEYLKKIIFFSLLSLKVEYDIQMYIMEVYYGEFEAEKREGASRVDGGGVGDYEGGVGP